MKTKIPVSIRLGLVALVTIGAGRGLEAGEPQAVTQAQVPSQLPPNGSPPLLRNVQVLFPTQGNVSSVDAQTYLYYMEIRESRQLAVTE